MTVLAVDDLRVSYATREGRREVVHGVSFEIAEGAVSYTHLTLPTKA